MKKVTYLVKVALSIALLLILYYRVGFSRIFSEIAKMNIVFVPVIVIVLFVTYTLATINIQLFTRALKYNISFRKLFKYYLLSWASGLLVPGKIGEFALVFLLRKEGVKLGEGFAIALLDKLITFFTLAVIAVIGLLLIFQLSQTATVVVAALVLTTIPILLMGSPSARRLVRKRILRKYEKKFKGFSRSFFCLMKNKVALYNTVLTSIKWVLSAATLWIFFVAFDIQIRMMFVFFIDAIATLVALIPVTINGLGIREGTAIYLYSLVNIPPPVVVSVYLLFITLNYVIGCLTFVIVRFEKSADKTSVTRHV